MSGLDSEVGIKMMEILRSRKLMLHLINNVEINTKLMRIFNNLL